MIRGTMTLGIIPGTTIPGIIPGTVLGTDLILITRYIPFIPFIPAVPELFIHLVPRQWEAAVAAVATTMVAAAPSVVEAQVWFPEEAAVIGEG